MPVDEAIILVARFLKSHDYGETLDALIREANLPPDAGTTNTGDLTLEKILEEKRVFDVSVNFERLAEGGNQWHEIAPAIANEISSPSSSNILHVSFAKTLDDSSDSQEKQLILATTADRRLNMLNVPDGTLHDSIVNLQDSPILSCALLNGGQLLTGAMSGQIAISDLDGKILDHRRDHNKYVVQIATHETADALWVATAGWDSKVNLYKLQRPASTPKFDAPTATITLQTNPEAILFIEHPDNGRPVLIVARRDSTHLYYYSASPELSLIGKQNIAPHANSWTHLTPSSLALCPTDNTLIAIACQSLPHMKLLIIRLLVPPWGQGESSAVPGRSIDTSSLAGSQEPDQAPATAARAALALQDREAAAIKIHCTTMAPQTAYSTPALTWRPGGTGIWVNSDDGVIRGIEASTGKVVATLKGHEPGSKIRCLTSGLVEENGAIEEWLVSGGFDHKLIVWKPEK